MYEEYKKIDQPKGYDDGGIVDEAQKLAPLAMLLLNKGGKVPEHNESNLKHLKESFDKFISEEDKETPKGYADGGEVEEGYHEVDASQDPMIQKYKDLGMLSGPTIAPDQPDEALVTGRPQSNKETSEDNSSDEEPKEDLKDYKEEDEDAQKTVDSKKALEDELDKEIEDSKDEEKPKDKKDEEPDSQELNENQKQDIATKGFSAKTEGIKPTSDIGSPEALAKAQAERQSTINNNNALQLSNLAGAGIAGAGGAQVSPLPANYFQSLNSGANLPVQNIQEQLANQQNDPNSPVSKVVSQYLTNKGFNLPPGTSASDAMKVMPFLQKDQALQNAIQKVVMQQKGAGERSELANKTKSDIAEENRKAAMERQRVANEGKVKASVAGLEAKTGKEQRDASVKAENDLNSTRGKQALMIAQRNLMAVKNAQKMFEEFPDPNKWTPSQVALFNTEMAKIASGGAPTEGMMHELSNPTAASGMAGLISKISNVPVGAQQGKFIELNKKYLDGLSNVSQQTIKDNMGNVIKSYEDKLGPEKYKDLLYRHSDMLGLFTPKQERGINAVMQAKGLSRQDAIKGLIQQGAIKDLSY